MIERDDTEETTPVSPPPLPSLPSLLPMTVVVPRPERYVIARKLLISLSGLLAALAVAVPEATLLVVPILGALSLKALIATLAATLGGWALPTPGHVPKVVPQPERRSTPR